MLKSIKGALRSFVTNVFILLGCVWYGAMTLSAAIVNVDALRPILCLNTRLRRMMVKNGMRLKFAFYILPTRSGYIVRIPNTHYGYLFGTYKKDNKTWLKVKKEVGVSQIEFELVRDLLATMEMTIRDSLKDVGIHIDVDAEHRMATGWTKYEVPPKTWRRKQHP